MQIGPAANRCRAVSMPGSGISDCMTMQAPKTILAPCDQPVHELCNKCVTEALLRPCITAKPQVRGGTTDESACTPGSVPRGAVASDGHPSPATVAGGLQRSTRRLGRAALERLRSRPADWATF